MHDETYIFIVTRGEVNMDINIDWGSLWKIFLLIIGSFGGCSAILLAFAKWFGGIIADRSIKKYELKIEKELSQYKSNIDNSDYVSRARFDVEFNAYKELALVAMLAFDDIKLLTEQTASIKTEDIFKKISSFRNTYYSCMVLLTDDIRLEVSSAINTLSSQLSAFLEQETDDADANDSYQWKGIEEIMQIRDNLINCLHSRIASYKII